MRYFIIPAIFISIALIFITIHHPVIGILGILAQLILVARFLDKAKI